MNKKKCLLILPREIHPTIGGYALKSIQAVELLNKHYELTVVVISSHKISEAEIDFYQKNTTCYHYISFPKWRFLLNAVLAIFKKKPIQVGYFYFRKVQKIIDNLIADQDIAVGILIRAMKYLENTPKSTRVVVDMVDSIGLNYQHSQKNVKSFFWKYIYKIETNRLLKYEQYWVEKAAITYFVNQQESIYWSKFGNTKLISQGVNEALFSYNNTSIDYAKCIAFIGKMDYQPNIDAVKWYLNNIHPHLEDTTPFIVVGANPTPEITKLAKRLKNVIITGFVDDPFLILKSAMAVVAPMQTGGGIQNKVLESMALGTITIVTTLTARSIINAIDGKDFILADTPQEFINCIRNIQKKSTPLYQDIKVNSRNFIYLNYTWDIHEKQYIEGIDSAFRDF